MSSAPAASPPGESLSQITDDFRRRLGISARLLPMTDDRVRTRLLHRRGLARFPGLFRAAAMRPGRCRDRLCRRRDGAAAPGFPGGARRPKPAHGRDLPVEPVYQHRSDPEPAGGARGIARLPCAGRRGVADHRRQGGQGPDRQDDGTSSACRSTPPRWRGITRDLLDRLCGRRADAAAMRGSRPAGGRDPHPDGDARRPRGAGASGAGQRSAGF